MKRPLPVAVFLCFILALPAAARIGESRQALEQRLFGPGQGTKYSHRFIDGKFDRDDQRVPVLQWLDYFPEDVEVVVYFKHDIDKEANSQSLDNEENPKGWDLYVIYMNGRSVMETYRRNGAPLSRHERNGLLVLQRGDSNWAEVQGRNEAETTLGFDYYREDNQLFAKRDGNMLTFYPKRIDEMITALKKIEDAEADAEARENAPESIRGF